MDLFEATCLTLWWTEGTKLRKGRWNSFVYSVEITNTDPTIISLFIRYLREWLGVSNSKIKLQVQIHEGDDQEEFENFWQEETGIPRNQFNKTIVRPAGNKIGKSKGTCKVRVHDKKLYLEIFSRLEKLRGVVHR